MQYNFRGQYDSTTTYVKKDVVAYRPTENDATKYYFCLTDNNGQPPIHNTDSSYWAIINALSNFPNSVDTFLNHKNIHASDKPNLARFQELSLKNILTPNEQDELNSLTQLLRDKLITPEDFNALQDSISNLQMFFKTNVEAYIMNLQNEFTTFINRKQNEFTEIIQDVDSRTARYYQIWNATSGQIDFNIYSGGLVANIPVEANLNIPEENIDLIISGTSMTPYQDFTIVNNGSYNTIRLTSNASSLIGNGTEIVARWYKNVGKLYFKHASTHGEGGTDPLTVTEGMLNSALKTKVNNVNKKITVGTSAPSLPATYDVWIDVN